MTTLAEHVDDYLAMRRSLGFELEFPGHVLPQFAAFVEAAGSSSVTVELAVTWASLAKGSKPISLAHRLGAVRGFARWLKTIDPATEIPPCGIWPSATPRRTPYIWSDAEIEALLEAAGRLPTPLGALTYETLFGLVAATGMRLGETLGLELGDVDLAGGLLSVKRAKFNRSRLVPLHDTTTEVLRRYVVRRRDLLGAEAQPFFSSRVGTPLSTSNVHKTFNALTTAMGLRTATVRPRVHDLRHSFTVRTLLDWHRQGLDVRTRMTQLSTYLGHVTPQGTYWYLSAVPELMVLVADHLDHQDVDR